MDGLSLDTGQMAQTEAAPAFGQTESQFQGEVGGQGGIGAGQAAPAAGAAGQQQPQQAAPQQWVSVEKYDEMAARQQQQEEYLYQIAELLAPPPQNQYGQQPGGMQQAPQQGQYGQQTPQQPGMQQALTPEYVQEQIKTALNQQETAQQNAGYQQFYEDNGVKFDEALAEHEGKEYEGELVEALVNIGVNNETYMTTPPALVKMAYNSIMWERQLKGGQPAAGVPNMTPPANVRGNPLGIGSVGMSTGAKARHQRFIQSNPEMSEVTPEEYNEVYSQIG